MAARQPRQSHPAAAPNAVSLNSFTAVVRAAWRVATRDAKKSQDRAQAVFIDLKQGKSRISEQVSHSPNLFLGLAYQAMSAYRRVQKQDVRPHIPTDYDLRLLGDLVACAPM